MADYYVATTGNDTTGDGSIGTPWKTIGHGASQMSGGDRLIVRAGTYAEAISNNIPGGASWAAPTRIVAYTGETVWLKPNSGNQVVYFSQSSRVYIEFDGINLDGSNVSYDIVKIEGWSGGNPHHIRLQNAELKGAHVNNGHHKQHIICTAQVAGIVGSNEFINLTLHGHGWDDFDHGFYIQSSNNLVEGCTIYDFCGAGVHIYSAYGHTYYDNIVRSNIIRDGHTGASGQRGWGILSSANSRRTKIYNNLIHGIPNSGSPSAGIYLGLSNAADAEVYHNTVYGCGGYGIRIDSPYSGAIVTNNIAWGNTAGNYTNTGTGTVASDNLGASASGWTASDPVFVDAGSDDFHLQASSPAIDAGATISTITTDLEGSARPEGAGYDIGCYEYGGTPGSGTEPETGVTGVYVGSFTVTAGAGTETITGLPFQPVGVLFFGCPAVFTENTFGHDSAGNIADFGGSGAHLFIGGQTTAGALSTEKWGCAAKAFDNQSGEQTCVNGNTDYPINQIGKDGYFFPIRNEGYISAYTADGFVVTQTNAFDSYAGTTVHFVAFSSAFTLDTAKEDTVTGSTGDDTIDAEIAIAPTALILAPTARTVAGAASGFSWSVGCAGLASGVITQGGASVQAVDDANPSDLYHYQRTDKAVVLIKQDGSGLQKEATVTGLTEGAISINTTSAGTGTVDVFAIGGTSIAAQVVTVTQPTATGAQVISGLTVGNPVFVLLLSVGAAASTDLEQGGYSYAIGASDGTRQRVACAADTHGAAPSVNVGYSGDDCIFLAATPAASPASSTVLAKASLTSLDPDGFTLDWTTADSTPRELIALVIGLGDSAPSPSRHNLLTGSTHTVTGADNLIAGANGTVTGDRNAYFALCNDPPALTANQTFKVCATTIDLDATTATLNDVAIGDVTGPGSATDEAIARFNGDGKTLQNSAITITDAGALGLPDGVRQTFNPDATNAGLNVGSLAGDPSAPSNGDLWYDSAANELTARINGANVALGAAGGGSWIPLVDGSEPPVFVTDGSGHLILVAYP